MNRPRLILALAALALPLAAPSAHASRTQETQLQDDNLLIYQPPGDVSRRLDEMKAMGVDRVRVTVQWRVVAPSPTAERKPEDFDAANPGRYPEPNWRRYDALVRLAAAKGIGVNFNVSAPAPRWATPSGPREDLQDVWEPDAGEFELFVRAVGTRYSGTYDPCAADRYCDPLPDVPGSGPLPRVAFWSIWNEPNVAAWLAPQWSGTTPVAAARYRALLAAGWRGLAATGHAPGADTILIGDLAPKGQSGRSVSDNIKPLVFLRALYCVDANLNPLRGSPARVLGCPESGSPAEFAGANPGLFDASGFGHHPYALLERPRQRSRDPDFVQIADLRRLTRILDRLFARYGRSRRIPIYLTEFGYQTKPPDPFGVAPKTQAAYINESEFMAYREKRVASFAQFLLVDDGPRRDVPESSPQYWANFQSGLIGLDGRRKTAYGAFRLPIHVPDARDRRGRFRVWGAVRPAANGTTQQVRILFRPRGRGAFTLLRTVTVRNANGYLDTTVRVSRSGQLRLEWNGPDGRLVSRAVRVVRR